MWQTRTICEYIACTLQLDKDQPNELLESAHRIGREDDDEDKPPEPEQTTNSLEGFITVFSRKGGGLRPAG